MAKERKDTAIKGKLTEDQVKKLKQDLEITQSNLDIFNELLTELRPGEVILVSFIRLKTEKKIGASRGQETSR